MRLNHPVLILCLCLIGLLSACGSSDDPLLDIPGITYTHNGLDQHIINRLYQHEQTLYAATDRGLYRKTGSSGWQAAGLAQLDIHDIAILSEQHIIASVRATDDEGIFSDSLQETTDSGQSWHEIEHNFGGEETETLFGLHYDADHQALYATGIDALAVSHDEGRSWSLLAGIWGGFGQPKSIVNRNPETHQIWYGGQNALEQMVLNRYDLDTGTEEYYRDLLPSPSVIYGIQFDRENSQQLYVSGEGGVLRSDDNGDNWIPLIDDVDYRFYFNVVQDVRASNILYTAGWDKNWDDPQPLIFEVSTDRGETWTQHQHPSNTLFGGVRSLLATQEGDRSVVYLGLYRGGIMRIVMPR